MTRKELNKAVNIVRSQQEINVNRECLSKFDGFGLGDFKEVVCTIEEIAYLVYWQCMRFDGGLDTDALDVIYQNKRKFVVV